MSKPLITIFTPAYNRRPYLRPLYSSILRQDFSDFEWVIVDDGSTDGTQLEITDFINEKKIRIQYYRQENAGKHVAVNRGVRMAQGTLFFIVDSDDLVAEGGLQAIASHWEAVSSLPHAAEFAGVCGTRVYPDGRIIGGPIDYNILDATAVEYRFAMGYEGDRGEVLLTRVMAKYPYPQFSGERFCADALVWNRIGQKFKLRFFDTPLIVCEYLPGGITDTSVKLRKQSPQGSCLYYAEMRRLPGLTAVQRLKATMNFWRFAVYDDAGSVAEKYQMIRSPWSFLLHPIARLWKMFAS